MTRFDATERPLWSLVGEAYLQLLEPLRINSAQPLAGRPQYVKTLHQIGARPTRGDLEAQGFVLTQAMPALAVHVRESRVEARTTRSLDWQLDVEVHCFCGGMRQGDVIRQDVIDGTRGLAQHVTEFLHARLPPTGISAELDGEGIEIQSIEHIVTSERVDWWVVRTAVMVRQEIHRQRTAPIEGIDVRQIDERGGPLATTIIDFDQASALLHNTQTEPTEE